MGTQLGSSGYYCIFNDTGNHVTLRNLSPSTTYTIRVYEYDGLPGFERYNKNTASSNPKTIATGKANQIITFNTLPAKTYGDTAIHITASSNMGLPVTFSSSNLNIATIVDNKITIVGAGIDTITASQVGNSQYNPASAQQTLTVSKAQLTITVNDTSRMYGSSNPAFRISYSGFENGDNNSAIDTLPIISTTALATTPVGKVSITASGASSKNYSFNYINGNLTINKAPLIISVVDTSRYYGYPDPTDTQFIYNGFKNNETYSVLTTMPIAAASDLPSLSAGSHDTIIVSGASASNYAISYIGGKLEITKAPLTATALDTSRIYGDANPNFRIKYEGFKNGETVSALTSLPSAYSTATASTAVGTATISVSGGSASNYLFNYNTGTLTINKASLTLTIRDTTRIYGDADPNFRATFSGFKNGENSSNISFTLFSYESYYAQAGSTNPISAYNVFADNYDITTVNGTLTIEKAPLTVTVHDTSRIYGNVNPTFRITYSGFKNGESADNQAPPSGGEGPVITLSYSPIMPTVSCAADFLTNAATDNDIIVSDGDFPNYTLSYVNAKLTIEKAVLIVTANDTSRLYGNPDPAFRISYSGFKNNETVLVLDTLPIAKSNAIVSSNVGQYNISLSGGQATNYTFNNISGKLMVNPAQLTVTAADTSRFYGDANPQFRAIYDGFKNGENTSVLSQLPTIYSTATDTTPAGSIRPIIAKSAISTNYAFKYVNGQLAIAKALLIVSAIDTSRYYGDPNPSFRLSYNGFKNGETPSKLSSQVSVSSSANDTTYAGSMPAIVVAGGNSVNYTISRNNATLTILKAILTATVKDTSRVYGEPDPEFKINYTGFKNHDSVNVLSILPIAKSTAGPKSKVGAYAINLSGGNSVNYVFNNIGGWLTIKPADLTVTVISSSRIYGDANPVFQLSYTGFMNGETDSVLITKPIVITSVSPTTGIGSYTNYVTGGSATNYILSYNSSGGQFDIKPAVITAMVHDTSRLYGDPNPYFRITYSGFKNNESATVFTEAPNASTSALPSTPAGSIPIHLDGGKATNYTFNNIAGTLTINKAPLTIAVHDTSRVYGAKDPAFRLSYSGFKNGDGPLSLSDSPMVSSTATVNSPADSTYAIYAYGAVSPNYDFNYINGALTIIKANQTITIHYDTLSVIRIGDVPYTLVATSTSGLPVTFTSSNPKIAAVSGDALTPAIIGTTTITAMQDGNENYNAAPEVTHDLEVIYQSPEICMVTVANNGITDTIGHNVIVWDRESIVKFKSYNVYRESTVVGVYDKIGAVSYEDAGIFIDTLVNPRKQAYFYKLTAVDSNNVETDINLSKYSKTMHLVTTVEYGKTGVQLQWDEYIGFPYSTYYIHRSSNGTDFPVIDSMASSSTAWTDVTVNPASGPNDPVYYYYVGVRKTSPCNPFGTLKAGGGVYAEAGSNMEDNRLRSSGPGTLVNTIPALKLSETVFPNPFDDITTVRYQLAENVTVGLTVYDLLGNKVMDIVNASQIAGNYQYRLTMADLKGKPGIYFVRLTAGKNIIIKKLVALSK